jgi:hypothetical protein
MHQLASAAQSGGGSTPQVTVKVPILGGKCQLYTRPNSKYWWAVFYHRRKAICTSTKQTDQTKAEAAATNWYIQRQAEILNGHGPTHRTKTFSYASDKVFAEYEADMQTVQLKLKRPIITCLTTNELSRPWQQEDVPLKLLKTQQLHLAVRVTGHQHTCVTQITGPLPVTIELHCFVVAAFQR